MRSQGIRLRGEEGEWRVRCLGAPDWMEAAGTEAGARVAFSAGDRLIWGELGADGDGAAGRGELQCLRLPDAPEGLAGGPGWIGVLMAEGALRVDRRTGGVTAEVARRHAWAEAWQGRELLVECAPGGNVAWRMHDGRELLLPTGAIRSPLLRPWAAGIGVVWVEGDSVRRTQGAAGQIGRPVWLTAGAGGAFAAGNGRQTLIAPAGGTPRLLDHGWSSAFFDGAALLCLSDGARWLRVPLLPVPERLEGGQALPSPGGRLVGADVCLTSDGALWTPGGRIGAGLCGAPPARQGSRLAGPGLRCHDLDSGAAAGSISGIPFFVGAECWEVTAAGCGPLGAPGWPHGLDRLGDRPVAAAFRDGLIHIHSLDGEEQLRWPDGRLHSRRRRPPPAAPPLTVPGLPLPASGVWEADRIVAWTRSGMLLEQAQPM